MSSEQRSQQEPSMEEILSSIRRIIHEGDAAGEGDDAGSRQAEEPVLELTQMLTEEGEVVDLAERRAVEGGDASPSPTATGPAEEKATMQEAAPPGQGPSSNEANSRAEGGEESLLSRASAAAAAGALARLAQQARPAQGPVVASGDRTVEAFLADLLKPMMRDWLNDNLPLLVERIVREEIEKLARRG